MGASAKQVRDTALTCQRRLSGVSRTSGSPSGLCMASIRRGSRQCTSSPAQSARHPGVSTDTRTASALPARINMHSARCQHQASALLEHPVPGPLTEGSLQQAEAQGLQSVQIDQGLPGNIGTSSLTPCGHSNSMHCTSRHTLQTGEQPSPDSWFPSSHCSSPSTMPLPHSVSQRTTCSRPQGNSVRVQLWKVASGDSCMQTT